jgi:hypothetical protein
MGETRNAYIILVGIVQGKRPLGKHRWEDNIKMHHRKIACEVMNWLRIWFSGKL